MKKLLYLTTSLGLLSPIIASDDFSWSDDKAVLMQRVSAIERCIANSREDFYSETCLVEVDLQDLKKAKDPDAALKELDYALGRVTESGVAKTKMKDIPAVTAEREVVEKDFKKFRIFSYPEFKRTYESTYRELLSRPDVRNVRKTAKESEVSGVLMSIPIFGWFGGAVHKYDGRIDFEVVSKERYVVTPARREARSLQSLKDALESMKAILITQQRRYRDKKAAEELEQRKRALEEERRRQAAAEAEARRKAEAKAKQDAELKRQQVRAELDQRARDLTTLSAKELREIAHRYDAGDGRSALDGHQQGELALKFITKAHEMGDSEATVTLGVWSSAGSYSLKQSSVMARKYFKQALLQNAQWTRPKYGSHYKHWQEVGQEVKAEREAETARRKAVKEEADRKAAEIEVIQGDKEKLHALAQHYEKGENGKATDKKYAVKLYKMAADLGHEWSAFMVVNICFNILQDEPTAKEYARKAFKLGQRNCWGETNGFGKFFHEATLDLLEEDKKRQAEKEMRRKAKEEAAQKEAVEKEAKQKAEDAKAYLEAAHALLGYENAIFNAFKRFCRKLNVSVDELALERDGFESICNMLATELCKLKQKQPVHIPVITRTHLNPSCEMNTDDFIEVMKSHQQYQKQAEDFARYL